MYWKVSSLKGVDAVCPHWDPLESRRYPRWTMRSWPRALRELRRLKRSDKFSRVTCFSFGRVSFTDTQISEVLQVLDGLGIDHFDLSGTAATDTTLLALMKQFNTVWSLSVGSTTITEAALMALAGLNNLREISFFPAVDNISDEMLDRFAKLRPDIDVIR